MNTLHASPLPLFSIDDHILTGDNITFRLSPNTSGRFQSGSPDTIVIHFAAGSSLASSVNVLTNADSGVSAHFVVGRNGDIVQMLPTNKIAWHAGESHYEGRSGLNQYSIGIELDNAGQLKARGDGTYESWFGEVYGENEVLTAQHA
ncbi:MAG: N-acetylmuramoyl-L-alanine amidase, partial [Pseudomonadota bacterium]|nr:N-acetylmuramoyl-L-alanine amidase [Pseudomonadota bacterium]